MPTAYRCTTATKITSVAVAMSDAINISSRRSRIRSIPPKLLPSSFTPPKHGLSEDFHWRRQGENRRAGAPLSKSPAGHGVLTGKTRKLTQQPVACLTGDEGERAENNKLSDL